MPPEKTCVLCRCCVLLWPDGRLQEVPRTIVDWRFLLDTLPLFVEGQAVVMMREPTQEG